MLSGDGVHRSAEPSRLFVDVEMVRALSFAGSSFLSDTRAESSSAWCSQAVSLLTAELGLFAWFLSSAVHTDHLGQPGFVQLAIT